MIMKISHHDLLETAQMLMTYFNQDRSFGLAYNRIPQAQLLHCCEGSVQFTHIFVWRIRKLINHANYNAVSGESLLQNVPLVYMGRKASGALDLDSVVEDSNMNVIRNTVVPVKHCISYNLM